MPVVTSSSCQIVRPVKKQIITPMASRIPAKTADRLMLTVTVFLIIVTEMLILPTQTVTGMLTVA